MKNRIYIFQTRQKNKYDIISIDEHIKHSSNDIEYVNQTFVLLHFFKHKQLNLFGQNITQNFIFAKS